MTLLFIALGIIIWFSIGVLVARHAYKNGTQNDGDIRNIISLGPLALLHVTFAWFCELVTKDIK